MRRRVFKQRASALSHQVGCTSGNAGAKLVVAFFRVGLGQCVYMEIGQGFRLQSECGGKCRDLFGIGNLRYIRESLIQLAGQNLYEMEISDGRII